MKASLCRRLGLSGVVVLTFDAALASLTAEEFVRKVLVERLDVGVVVAGWDFHFGKARSGNPAFLVEAGRAYGFAVEIVEKVEDKGGEEPRVVSSTAIRRALERGDVATAARGFGRPYAVGGRVVAGQRLGRALGVPTANIALEPTNRLAYGVYAVRALFEGLSHPAVASFGVRPTVGDGPALLEVHVLDYDGDLYGKEIEVEFIRRIREERKFDSLPALTAEMERDIARARAVLAAQPER
jgi:riboflavin kinase/FMN adenylyltransferase